MGRIEDLADLYGEQISMPWEKNLAGAQRVMVVVYEKDIERSLRGRIGEFEQRTQAAQHDWVLVDVTKWFAEWMVDQEYHLAYFKEPELLSMSLEGGFKRYARNRLGEFLNLQDENTVVAVTGTASLYGFLRVSELIRDVEPAVVGRLVVFFPGTKDNNNYRLLDARDGWNYLANCVSLHGERGIA